MFGLQTVWDESCEHLIKTCPEISFHFHTENILHTLQKKIKEREREKIGTLQHRDGLLLLSSLVAPERLETQLSKALFFSFCSRILCNPY